VQTEKWKKDARRRTESLQRPTKKGGDVARGWRSAQRDSILRRMEGAPWSQRVPSVGPSSEVGHAVAPRLTEFPLSGAAIIRALFFSIPSDRGPGA
jgi:hypothetical protein